MRNSQQLTYASLLAALCLATASAGYAQTNETTGQDADTETTATAPAQGQNEPYVAEKNGDWELRCVKVEEGPEPCQLYQILNDSNGGPVAEMVIFSLPEGRQAVAGAIVTTPLETLLTEQVAITVDGANGRKYPFSVCTTNGCVARIGLTAEDVQAFQRGNAAEIRIVPARAPDQEVLLTLSLAGFTASYQALTEDRSN